MTNDKENIINKVKKEMQQINSKIKTDKSKYAKDYFNKELYRITTAYRLHIKYATDYARSENEQTPNYLIDLKLKEILKDEIENISTIETANIYLNSIQDTLYNEGYLPLISDIPGIKPISKDYMFNAELGTNEINSYYKNEIDLPSKNQLKETIQAYKDEKKELEEARKNYHEAYMYNKEAKEALNETMETYKEILTDNRNLQEENNQELPEKYDINAAIENTYQNNIGIAELGVRITHLEGENALLNQERIKEKETENKYKKRNLILKIIFGTTLITSLIGNGISFTKNKNSIKEIEKEIKKLNEKESTYILINPSSNSFEEQLNEGENEYIEEENNQELNLKTKRNKTLNNFIVKNLNQHTR